MPTKATANGTKRYQINGKVFTWTTDDGATITIPMRLKLKVVRQIADKDMDVQVMFAILEQVAPGQSDLLDDMDVNDFTACFSAWQNEYTALTGATLGE